MERIAGTLTDIGGISGSLSIQDGVTGTVSDTEHIVGTLTGIAGIAGSLSAEVSVSGAVAIPERIPVEEYDGAYEFTPTADTQTIEIAYKKATANITINPIPQNYGLITWDGATLTVS